MHDFIKEVSSGFALTNELQAARLISEAGQKLKAKPLLDLTQTRSNAELEQLRHAIAAAREQYWLDRSEELRRLDTSMVDRVYVTGGTAQYFSAEIKELFRSKGVNPLWCGELAMEFYDRYGLTKKTPLLYRMTDCYGFYLSLPGVEPFVSKAVEVAHV